MIQLHSIFISTFASLIAPFGKFFTHSVKKAFNIKETTFSNNFGPESGMVDTLYC